MTIPVEWDVKYQYNQNQNFESVHDLTGDTRWIFAETPFDRAYRNRSFKVALLVP